VVLGLALAWTALATPSLAGDDTARAAARRMATAGVEAYQRDDFATAVDKLERAYQVLPAPSIGLWLARALAKQGHLVEASERYLEVTRLATTSGDTTVQAAAKNEAAAELEALTPRIPSVVIRVEGAKGAEVQLRINGDVVSSAVIGEPQPINPGKHRIEAQYQGQSSTGEVTIAPSETKTLTLRFSPANGRATSAGTRPAVGAGRGRLVVTASGEQDTVTIDGKVVGSRHWEGQLPNGEHVVRVAAPGKKTYEVRVQLAPGATRRLDVSLENQSKGSGPWLWIAGGAAVVAGAAVGGYFLFRPDEKPGSHPEGSVATIYLPFGQGGR
jgi:hypothetical protein